jgi:FKBP-type peptidyl-prolyl cis-trans isomerase
MTKAVFIFVVMIALVGATVWLVLEKIKEVTEGTTSVITVQATPSISTNPSKIEVESNITVELHNGLKVQDIVIGPGPEVRTGDLVSVHYVGMFIDGTKFDSSYDRDEAFVFSLGAGRVIKGWDAGIPGMKVGGKRKLIIPPELAYGAEGFPGGIPPNATLVFEIALLDARSGPGN